MIRIEVIKSHISEIESHRELFAGFYWTWLFNKAMGDAGICMSSGGVEFELGPVSVIKSSFKSGWNLVVEPVSESEANLQISTGIHLPTTEVITVMSPPWKRSKAVISNHVRVSACSLAASAAVIAALQKPTHPTKELPEGVVYSLSDRGGVALAARRVLGKPDCSSQGDVRVEGILNGVVKDDWSGYYGTLDEYLASGQNYSRHDLPPSELNDDEHEFLTAFYEFYRD